VFCLLRRMFGTGEHWKWGTLSTPTQQVVLLLLLLLSPGYLMHTPPCPPRQPTFPSLAPPNPTRTPSPRC